jgi:hypothetical protein
VPAVVRTVEIWSDCVSEIDELEDEFWVPSRKHNLRRGRCEALATSGSRCGHGASRMRRDGRKVCGWHAKSPYPLAYWEERQE